MHNLSQEFLYPKNRIKLAIKPEICGAKIRNLNMQIVPLDNKSISELCSKPPTHKRLVRTLPGGAPVTKMATNI